MKGRKGSCALVPITRQSGCLVFFGSALALVLGMVCSIASAAAATLTVLHSFDSSDGANPVAELLQATDGSFYGTTYSGGLEGCGTVFKMSSSGSLTTLHYFSSSDAQIGGCNPAGGIAQSADGTFYGTTYSSTQQGQISSYSGIVFSMTPAGAITTLVSNLDICCDHDYQNFNSTPVSSGDGNFFVTITRKDSTNEPYGSLWKISPEGDTLGTWIAGQSPNGVVLGADGNVYGTSGHNQYTSSSEWGSIFKIDPAVPGQTTYLHVFNPDVDFADGCVPRGMAVGVDGNFYGINSGCNGVQLFKVTPPGTFAIVADAPDAVDANRLILGSDGNFYGTTPYGGTASNGSVFRITPSGVVTTLHSFSGADGAQPYSALIETSDGSFYGTTRAGGVSGLGTVFKLEGAIGSAPIAPAELTAVAGNAAVTLSWVPAPGATSYNVYLGTLPGGESATPILNGVAGISATVSALANGTAYFFKVSAVNAFGTSSLSNEASATPVAGTVGIPNFDPPGGSYRIGRNVTMSDVTSGAAIHYTMDGSAPTSQSVLYTRPIPVRRGTTTIKAIAILAGYADSPVATAIYLVGPP